MHYKFKLLSNGHVFKDVMTKKKKVKYIPSTNK